ncbi:MAG: hypothetical protein H5T63_03575 [Chloroflexi bacterium]|nr:hypothetical protein [Chloroflexota bacterium]
MRRKAIVLLGGLVGLLLLAFVLPPRADIPTTEPTEYGGTRTTGMKASSGG